MIAALTLAIRLLALLLVPDGTTGITAPDTQLYIDIARHLAGGLGFSIAGPDGPVPDIERMPLYPAFLALAIRLSPDAYLVVALWAQIILSAVTAALLAATAFRWGRIAGWVVGVCAACIPNLVAAGITHLPDTLFLTAIAALFVTASSYLARPSWKGILWVTLAMATMIYTRPVAQYLPILVLSFLILPGLVRAPIAVRGAHTAVFCLGLAILLAPWVARHHGLTGSVSLVAQGPNHVMNWILPELKRQQTGQGFEEASAEIRSDFQSWIDLHAPSTHGSAEINRLRGIYARERLAEVDLSVLASAWIRGAVINMAAPAMQSFSLPVSEQGKPSFYEAAGAGVIERAITWLSRFTPLSRALILAEIAITFALAMSSGLALALLAFRRLPLAVGALLIYGYVLGIMGPVTGARYRLPLEPVTMFLSAMAFQYGTAALPRVLQTCLNFRR